jgi:hypothetical protein
MHDFSDTDYWYAEFFNHETLHHLKNYVQVLKLTDLEKIRDRKCILMLNNAHEAFHEPVKVIYDMVVMQLGLPPEQITLLSESATINLEVEKIANEYNLPKIKTEWLRIFEYTIKHSDYKPIITLEDKQYDKKFLNLNRRWRLHRPTFVALLELNDILDKGYVSLARSDDDKNWNTFKDDISWIARHNTEFLANLIKNFDRIRQIPPMTLDRQDMVINPIWTYDNETNIYYENSYFSVVTETNYFKILGEGIFLSEKIFKPILKKHPFIVLSRPHTLLKLKELGYKTFSGIINEDYDNEEDDIKRMLMVLEETKRLCNLGSVELSRYLSAAKEIVEYNHNVLMNKTNFITKL